MVLRHTTTLVRLPRSMVSIAALRSWRSSPSSSSPGRIVHQHENPDSSCYMLSSYNASCGFMRDAKANARSGPGEPGGSHRNALALSSLQAGGYMGSGHASRKCPSLDRLAAGRSRFRCVIGSGRTGWCPGPYRLGDDEHTPAITSLREACKGPLGKHGDGRHPCL